MTAGWFFPTAEICLARGKYGRKEGERTGEWRNGTDGGERKKEDREREQADSDRGGGVIIPKMRRVSASERLRVEQQKISPPIETVSSAERETWKKHIFETDRGTP